MKSLLKWNIVDHFGIIWIGPLPDSYANGSVEEQGLCFYNEDDAVVQLSNLINILRQRKYEKHPATCTHCGTAILYETTLSDPNWTCKKCGTWNMGS